MELSYKQAFAKRAFDLILSVMGLFLTWWLILIAWMVATLDTRQNGFFVQKRIGRLGRLFTVIKIRTMRNIAGIETTVTMRDDPRITAIGKLLRKTKIDELPQLINVLLGHMSFVGPRPDVPGFADKLKGEERLLLTIRPGITGPATIKYRNEEDILQLQDNPEAYNRDVIYPDKVQINLAYIRNWNLAEDIKYIFATIKDN
jgi:lipopolysaccharide/colanic/teichoic acid biosynthesis glycosyltransferase